MTTTMGNFISQSAYDAMSEEEQAANTKEVISDNDYAQMQAT